KMVNGLPQGRGRAVQEDGHVYEGLFVDGLYEDDNGTMYMKNGDKYVGTFRSCYFHGPGAYYFQSNGNSYKGKFVKGQPSPGTVVYDSGGKVINKF
ncbi:MAG: phosphatidylinositol-4-phosphate 5-kinase, partial [Bacteroidaceae bacterium]|nr:phosphatidylinositol-4-phosphate 5-kinase [Bacteroidaceae bacterium]